MLVTLLTLLLAAPGGIPSQSHQHPGPRAATSARRIGDAEILGTLGTFDANASESAKLGSTKAHSQEVRDYAKMLLVDHQRSQQAGLRLAKLLRIAPVLPSDSSITRAHKAEMDQFNLISTAEFDKAFVQSMVADYKMMINKIDAVLLPAATHVQLKRFIRDVRPSLVMHQTTGQGWLDKQKP